MSDIKPKRLFLDKLPTPIGVALIITDEEGSLRVWGWEDLDVRMRKSLRILYPGTTLETAPIPTTTRQALDAYFGGDMRSLDDIPFRIGGTTFQRAVWTALRNIAPGTTLSYGTLAQRLGVPKAVRAVGLANGANPISIVIPCHRVIGSNGSLTGYGGGITRKQWLLTHERVPLALQCRDASHARA